VDRLLARPRVVVGTLIGAQIGATIVLALAVDHNGWVWFQGGDQIWLATQGWLLGQLDLPPTELGYLWSYALTPIMWITGPTFVQALPPLVVLQVLVLGPIALLCVYDLACRVGGRLLGYWAALLWTVAPFATIPLFVDRYQERFGEQFLPQALGLTAMSDYPSMVLLLAAAVFVARSLESAQWHDAVLAGLLLGAATAIKPPNLLMGVGAALAYLVARRFRNGLASAPPSSRPSCSSRSGRSAGSAGSPRSVSRRRGSQPPRRRPRSRSTSTSTSTSISTTGSRRWTSCASSSSARESHSGRPSRACSRSSACGEEPSPRSSRAGSARSSS
jgi:hypothetical protein